MVETQQTISEWAEETFGPAKSNARIAARANTEMAELLAMLTADDADCTAIDEVADAVICLYRLATCMGFDLLDEVDSKMRINRDRKWQLNNDGTGQHIT